MVKSCAPHPTPKLEFHPLSAVCDCLFSILASAVHVGGHSSIRNLRTCHAVVTGTHLWFSRKLDSLIAVTDRINYVNLQIRTGFLTCRQVLTLWDNWCICFLLCDNCEMIMYDL